jgi:hypothetical protein
MSNATLQKWQPIETAPKDGTPVLLVWRWDSSLHTGATVIMASWMCRKHAMLSSLHRCPDEKDCDMGWGNYAGEFSRWMPLPELPDSNNE